MTCGLAVAISLFSGLGISMSVSRDMTLDKGFEGDVGDFIEKSRAVAVGQTASVLHLYLWERRLFRADEPAFAVDIGNGKTEFEVYRQQFVSKKFQGGGVLERAALSLGHATALRIIENPDSRKCGQHRHRHTADAVQVDPARQVAAVKPMYGLDAGKYLSGGFHTELCCGEDKTDTSVFMPLNSGLFL